MLKFIIYNKIIDKLILVPAFINMVLCLVLDSKEYDKKDNKEKNTTKVKNDNYLKSFNDKVAHFYSYLIIIIVFILLKNNTTIYAFLIIIITLYFLYNIINNFFFQKIKLSSIDKKMYILSSFLLPVFLSSEMYIALTKDFHYLLHPFKESLLILFLNIKIIIYLFLFLINISILISNTMLLLINHKHLIKVFEKSLSKEITYSDYNYYLYKKHNSIIFLNVDRLIYFLSFPIYLLFFLIKYIFWKITIYVIKVLLKLLLLLIDFDLYRNIIIKTLLKISSIISLVTVYIITLYNQLFSQQIISLYELITTVILIPLIYDSFKNTHQSKKRETKHN